MGTRSRFGKTHSCHKMGSSRSKSGKISFKPKCEVSAEVGSGCGCESSNAELIEVLRGMKWHRLLCDDHRVPQERVDTEGGLGR